MSSKKAMKQAQKMAFAYFKSSITNSKLNKKKTNFITKINKKVKSNKLSELQVIKQNYKIIEQNYQYIQVLCCKY